MKITPQCSSCLLKRCVYEAQISDESKVDQVIRVACEELAKHYDPRHSSAGIATKVHRAVYDVLGTTDPYADIKEQSNSIARSLLPKANSLMVAVDDPMERLRLAALLSVIGNVMDFGIDSAATEPEALATDFDSLVEAGLGVDEIEIAIGLLSPGDTIPYFTDNCGEIVFDVLMVNALKDLGFRVVGVVKGESILTDATRENALSTGFAEAVDELMVTPSFYVGVELSKMSENLKELMKESKLMIAKGMANFEAFSEKDLGPILYLMRTKCKPVATALGVPENLSVAKLWR